MSTLPTSDEKVTAALTHGSIFLVFFGPIIPLLIWVAQRKKSKYVSFHALQAMGYQVLMFWLWIVIGIVIMVLALLLIFPLTMFMMKNPHNTEFAPFLFQMFIFVFVFGSMGLFFLVGIIGAVSCLVGRDFRYPILGKWLQRYLSYDASSDLPINELQEDNWIAGICHATATLRLWGIITPLIVWFTQKERSAELRFQSLQASIYQGIAFLAYLIGMLLYMFSFFAMFFSFFTAGMTNGGKEIQGPGAVVMLIFIGMMMIFWLAFTIVVPLYLLLAGLGSVRVIRGHHFRYPILGQLIAKRMENVKGLEPAL